MKQAEAQHPEWIEADSGRRRRWSIGLALAALVFMAWTSLFYNLGGYKTLGSHEVYSATPARTMLASADWVVPRIAGQPRLAKPPMGYWLVAGSARLFGGLNEWTARFPAACSGFLLAALMGLWSYQWYGPRTALPAAAIQMTSVYAITFARKAEVDMFQTLCMMGALYVFTRTGPHLSRHSRWLHWTGFYVLLSLTWLSKFHFGTALVIAPIVVYLVTQRRIRELLNLFNPLGLAILAAAALVWPMVVSQQVPSAWEVWTEQTVGRAVGELSRQPLWYYIPYLFWLPMPWSIIILSRIRGSWREAWKEQDPKERFLWVWFLTGVAVLTLSANKHSNYLLAVLPMFTLLGSRQIDLLVTRLRDGQRLVSPRVFYLLQAGSIAICLAAGGLALRKYPNVREAVVLAAMLLAIGLTFITWLAQRGRLVATSIVAVVLMSTSHLLLFGQLTPILDHRLNTKLFVEHARAERGDEEIWAYKMDMTEIAYYIDEPLRLVSDRQTAQQLIEQRDHLTIITYIQLIPEFTAVGSVEHLATLRDLPSQAPTRHPPLVLLTVQSRKDSPQASQAATDSSIETPNSRAQNGVVGFLRKN